MSIKLSPAQLRLLKEKNGRFINNYKPGRKLMELGLINGTETKSSLFINWAINAAGEDFLSSLTAKTAKKNGCNANS